MKLFYDVIYRYFRAPWDIGAREELASLVESGHIKPGRAIDLGCGTGANAIYLAQNGFELLEFLFECPLPCGMVHLVKEGRIVGEPHEGAGHIEFVQRGVGQRTGAVIARGQIVGCRLAEEGFDVLAGDRVKGFGQDQMKIKSFLEK